MTISTTFMYKDKIKAIFPNLEEIGHKYREDKEFNQLDFYCKGLVFAQLEQLSQLLNTTNIEIETETFESYPSIGSDSILNICCFGIDFDEGEDK